MTITIAPIRADINDTITNVNAQLSSPAASEKIKQHALVSQLVSFVMQ